MTESEGQRSVPISGELAQERPIDKVVSALSKAQAKFTTIPKTKLNPHYKSKYSSLDDIMEMATPHLCEQGLALTCLIRHTMDGWDCATRLYHTSGQYLEAVLPLIPGSEQKIGSQLTYYRRYGACALLNIVSDEDMDGEEPQSGSPAKSRQRASSKATRSKVPAGRQSPAVRTDPKQERQRTGSKAGDGTPAKAYIASLWPQVYRTGAALGMDKDGAVAWFRDKCAERQLPSSTKDLTQPQVNELMLWLHNLEQEEIKKREGTPAELPLKDEEPPPHGDDDGPQRRGDDDGSD